MDFEEKYQALLRRDPAFDGVFFTAVRTTGVFCRPSCRARHPKAENVEFFDSSQQALLAGYRPCKVCHPLETKPPVPPAIQELIAEVEADPSVRIRDDELRRRGLEPATVRRWFKEHHGLTFQGYQRSRRLSLALGLIREGRPVAEAAFACGYESLSGFTEGFAKRFGTSPGNLGAKRFLRATRLETPLGLMVAAAVDEGICLLEFADRRALETELAELEDLLDAVVVPGGNRHLAELARQLGEYFRAAPSPTARLGATATRPWPWAGRTASGRWPVPTAATGWPSSYRATGSSPPTASYPATAEGYGEKSACSTWNGARACPDCVGNGGTQRHLLRLPARDHCRGIPCGRDDGLFTARREDAPATRAPLGAILEP